jgi:ankyrin repeat protein
VDFLLSKEDVSVDIRKTGRDIRTALEIAASTGCTVDMARILLSRTNKSMYDFDPARGYTLLHFATCDMSDQTVLKQLLQGDIDIEVLNRAAETPLHTAVSQGNFRAVRLLLEAGANTATVSGATAVLPLHLAVQAGRLPIVQTLIEFGADVNASSKDTKSTAMHYASSSGSWGLVSFLIRMGALIDERDANRATPYVVAAGANHWHIVQKFTRFADLSVPDFDGLGVLHYAILAACMPVVRFLKKHCPALPQDIRDREGKIRGNELTCAIRSGNIDLFKMFWEDESKNFISDNGSGLAHFAVAANANDVRNLLLPHITEWNLSTSNMYSDTYPDRRYRNLKGLRPFHMAVLDGNHTAIAFLREKDLISDINTLTIGEEAYSSVHLATISGRASTVRFLAKIGADLNLKGKPNGQTPLHVAARLGFAGVVTALLDAGCMPNVTDDYGMTPELLAIEHEHHSVAKILGQHLDSLESNIGHLIDNNSSTSVLETHHGKPWKLPLAPSPHMSKVMTSNVSIYAVHNSECPEALYKALKECNNHGVYNLKEPFKRLV